MAAILWKFKLFNVALIWLQIRNLRPRISGIGLFLTLFIHFWRLFITCQNFEEICKYVRLTVCYLPKFSILASMFVCLFVCLFVGARRDTGRIVWAINTKLGMNMEHTCEKVCILFGVDDITDDVTRSKSRSNIKIVITQSIFELELRSKAQNVGYCTGYLDDIT